MVDLIEKSRMACDQLIDVTGRAVLQAVLQLSARRWPEDPPQQGKRRSESVVFYGRQAGQVMLSDRKLQVERAASAPLTGPRIMYQVDMRVWG